MLIFVGLFSTSVFTLLTPNLTTVGGFGVLFTIRLLEGICGVCVSNHAEYHITNSLFLWRGYITTRSGVCNYLNSCPP